MRVRVFRREGNNQYYFQFLRDDGQVILNSEGYTTENARDNGVRSIITNSGDTGKYETRTNDSGGHYFILKAVNGQEIGRSVTFRNSESRDGAITLLQSEGSTIQGGGTKSTTTTTGTTTTTTSATADTKLEAANRDANIPIAAPPPTRATDEPKKKRKKRSTPKKPKAEKVYVDKGNYLFNDITWDIFMSGGNKRYYFTFKNTEGKTLFLNADVRGFETQEEAKTVIGQIMRYAPYEANFEGKMARNGKYYFYIKGENDKKIGKSFFYASAEDMQSSVGLLLGTELQIAAMEETRKAATNVDEYLACGDYAGGDGFYKFKHEENGEFYFAYNDSNNTYLRSEGYTTEKARDNGIESVIKNAPLEERWKTMKDEEDGMWYYALRAGNHQEIARSCGYDSEAAMNTSWGWVRGEGSTIGKGAQYINGMWYSGGWIRRKREEEVAAAAALAAKKKADEEAKLKAEREAAQARARKKADEAAAARKKEEEEAAAAAARKKEEAAAAAAATAAAAAALAAKSNIDEYLECAAYQGEEDGFHRFKHENGEFYFSHVGDGKVLLRSEGYTTEKARDNGVESVVKNAPLEERWKTMKDEDDGMWYYSLRAGNHQEIARSCGYDSEAAMNTSWGWIRGEKSTLGKGAQFVGGVWYSGWWIAKKKEEEAAAAKNAEEERLRLVREAEVEEKKKTAAAAALAATAAAAALAAKKEEEEATAKKAEEERLRLAREAEAEEKKKAAAAAALAATAAAAALAAKKEEEEAAAVKVAEEKRKKEAAAAAAALAAATALAAKKKEEETALALAATKRKEEAAAAAAALALVEKKKREKVVAAAATTTKAAAASEGSGSMGWWPWLLLIPLLLAALWFAKGCLDHVAITPIEIITPQGTGTTSTSAIAAASVCACGGDSENAIFNIPSGKKAQTLTRLGTNPEFGNSHGLTGPKFLGKLRNRYATNSVDKKFLDDLFTAMGYVNGFGDATADMFTETTLANGKSGNMGYGENHGTTYTILDAKDSKDLEAFIIKAANGCDVHFMKTCGNHFFFCN